MKRSLFTLMLLAGLAGFAQAADEKKPDKKDPAAPAAEVKPSANPVVEMKTSLGTITIELNKEKAPVSVENFLKYVEKKHFDGTVFHRVIETFMIQGGGFEKKGDQLVEKDTMPPIKNESKNGLKNKKGTIAMARTNAPDSATSQFYINVVDNASLDFPSFDGVGYAVFGEVKKGMDVVDQIKAVKTAGRPLTTHGQSAPSKDVPVADIIIESVRLVAPAK